MTEQLATTGATALEKMVEYEAFESKEKIQLSAQMVIQFLCKPTKSGKICSKEQAMRFIMLCKTRGLNPWEGDAFIVGYDTASGPEFNLITAHQAFLKRAEVNANFEGMDSGVIVKNKDGELVEMPGDFFEESQVLKGAWAKIFLKNRPAHPVYKRIKLESFKKGFGRWVDDPAGMIVKCAEADAMRSAFPNTLGGMYMEGEMAQDTVAGVVAGNAFPAANSAVAQLEEKIAVAPATKLETELVESQKAVEAKKKKAEKPAEKPAEKKAPENINVDKSGVLEAEGDKNLPTDAEIDTGVNDIVAGAMAAAEEQEQEKAKAPEPVKTPEPVKEPEPQSTPAATTGGPTSGGINLRGVDFPAVLSVDNGNPKFTNEQLEQAKAEAARLGIDLGKFSMKRLKVEVDSLNKEAMGKLIEVLKAVAS